MATMTFDEFVKKYNGTSIDYDGTAGAQCVDLAKMYCKKVLDIKCGAFGNAENWYNGFNNIPTLKNNFERIANTPSFVPQRGDLCIFDKTSTNKYGHICIATGTGNTSYFQSYDMNYGSKPMQLVMHNYDTFLGVLRFKTAEKSLPILDKTGIKENDKNYLLKKMIELFFYSHSKIPHSKMDDNAIIGKGTINNINSILSYYGYNPNGIAGNNFAKLITQKMKEVF